jgi:hypothetical protein
LGPALDKSISDLDSAFEEFKHEEARVWMESGVAHPPKPEHLVKPSGSLLSPLTHPLNQPSFTTSLTENGETADKSNGYIAMVMGIAFQAGETLIYDQLHRRRATSEGLEEYPPKIIRQHEDFTMKILESSEAKVEVIYGAIVRDRLFFVLYRLYDILPL